MAPPLIVDGAGNPAPELQVRTNPDDYNESGVQETHAATTAEACREMARRYQKEGRKISLKDIRESGDPNLPYLCVFEGADAVEGYYQNDRYGKDN